MDTIYLGKASECLVKDIWGLIDVVFASFMFLMTVLIIWCILKEIKDGR